MRVLEILLMTGAGIWQAIRQDFNPLELAIVLAVVPRLAAGMAAETGAMAHPLPALARRVDSGCRHRRIAPGDSAAITASRPGGGRRVQPSAARRHAAARPRGESHASFLAAFRESSTSFSSRTTCRIIFRDTRRCSRRARAAHRHPWAGVLAECLCDSCGSLLDAARMDARALGVVRRAPGRAAIRHRQLLGRTPIMADSCPRSVAR